MLQVSVHHSLICSGFQFLVFRTYSQLGFRRTSWEVDAVPSVGTEPSLALFLPGTSHSFLLPVEALTLAFKIAAYIMRPAFHLEPLWMQPLAWTDHCELSSLPPLVSQLPLIATSTLLSKFCSVLPGPAHLLPGPQSFPWTFLSSQANPYPCNTHNSQFSI